MGSTGFRKGPAAFIFFRVRIVDTQKRYCATLNVGGPFGLLTSDGVSCNGAGETDAGGGVAVLVDNRYI